MYGCSFIKYNIKKIFSIYNLVQQLRFDQRRYILEQNILRGKDIGISDDSYCNHQIVVSLTTYDVRLQNVHWTIESVMEQTLKPNRIILWLDEGLKNKTLPVSLELLKDKGLEVFFCKDIRSYKKIIPTLYLCPNDAIITIDDDVIYEYDMVEKLVRGYQDNPSYIYCNRCHRMVLDKNFKLLPYRKWQWNIEDLTPNVLNFPTGVGGVLYPPNSLDAEVFNERVFGSICKYADDVWLKAMALKKGTLSKKVYTHNKTGEDYLLNYFVEGTGLCEINNGAGALNDSQIDAVFSKYNLLKLLK